MKWTGLIFHLIVMAKKQNLATWKEQNDIEYERKSYIITVWWLI
jgi:hypothetical protein